MKLKHALTSALVIGSLLAPLPLNLAQAAPKNMPLWEERVANRIYENSRNSIGRIEATIKGDDKHIIIGTGAVITSDGKVLTAAHVVAGNPPSIRIHFDDGRIYPVKVLKSDRAKDLALLQIQKQGSFQHLTLEDPENVVVGRNAYVLGYPLGFFPPLFMQGMVSRLNNNSNSRLILNMQANPGNSGGPVLDSDGKIIGVVIEIYRDTANDDDDENSKPDQLNTHITIAVSLSDIDAFLK
jgi:serine protease Do